MESDYRCQDCKDTGLIEVQSIELGRIYFDKELNGLMHEIKGKGDWHMNKCYCVGED